MAVALNVGPLVAPTSKADYVAGAALPPSCSRTTTSSRTGRRWRRRVVRLGRTPDRSAAGRLGHIGHGGRHRRRQHGAAGRPPFLRLSRRSAGIDRHRPAAPRALRLRSLHRAAARPDRRATPASDGKRAGGHRPALDRHGRAPARCAGHRAAAAQLRRRRYAAGGAAAHRGPHHRRAPAAGARRQVFFVSQNGYDNHTGLRDDHPALLRELGQALAASRRNWTGWGWPIR